MPSDACEVLDDRKNNASVAVIPSCVSLGGNSPSEVTTSISNSITTYPLTPQPIGHPTCTAGGEDYLELTIATVWPRTSFDAFVDALATADHHGNFSIGGLALKRAWCSSPRGSGRWSWRILCQGIELWIAHNRASESTTSIRVTVRGRECLLFGFDPILAGIRQILAHLGAIIRREVLTRVDLCLDIPGLSMAPFLSAYREKRYITRARSMGTDETISDGGTGSAPTLRFGRRNALQVRIYDKLAEMRAHGHEDLLPVMMANRWGGRRPLSAVRVEFQLRSQALRDRGIQSVQDYLRLRADLLRYLTFDWLRMAAKKVNRMNSSRAMLDPIWADIVDGFQNWAGQPADLPLTRATAPLGNPRRLIKQAIGLVLTVLVRTGQTPQTIDEFVAGFSDLVHTQVTSDQDLRSRVMARVASYPCGDNILPLSGDSEPCTPTLSDQIG